MKIKLLLITLINTMLLNQGLVNAAPEPQQVNNCSRTNVESVGARLEGSPEAGSYIKFTNGLYSDTYEPYSYGQSKKGDTVLLCLDNVPKGCPPGDDRGKSFIAINERNNIMFKVVKGHHFCGGA